MKEGDDVPLAGERPESAYFLSVNRNKRSMSVDFKTAKGLHILQRLVKQSDILVENYIPGEKLRIQ
jgi:succinate--hydroxymethylglutarate CoA-transferase